MSQYIYMLNGRTVTAVNQATNQPMVVAFAPYFIKPSRSEYEFLEAINAFRNAYDSWMSVNERIAKNKQELRHAGIYESGNYRYEEDRKMYWRFKSKILRAEETAKRLRDAGVTHVVFVDNRDSFKKATHPVNVYELNDSLWFDEPNFGTPLKGTIVMNNNKLNYTEAL